MFLKIYNKTSEFTKYIIGNIYRRPSSILAELDQFIEEFTSVAHNLQEKPSKSYLCGDYNINLLKIDSLQHYSRFFKYMTPLNFFHQITRPTKLSGNFNTLIDNIFTNNFCKPHLAGILVTPVSDHLMQFCIIKERQGRPIINFLKCIEVENINPLSISNFKHGILKSNVYEKLVKNLDCDPNQNDDFFRLRLQKQRRTIYQRKLSVLINTNIEKKNG